MKQKCISLFLLAAMLAATLTGCGGGKTSGAVPKAEKKVVLNEVAHSIFYAPMYVAIEEGYFAEEGIALQLNTGFGVIQK